MRLDYSRRDLTEVPLEILENKDVTILNLSRNNLTFLPEWLFDGEIFSELKELHLYENQLSFLPPKCTLNNLNILNLSHNQFSSLNSDFFKGMPSLDSLMLDYNKITSLPPNFFRGILPKLKTLFLGHNQLTSLHPDLFKFTLPILKRLFLNYNHLTSLHPDLFKENALPSLRWLYLDNNKITYLSSELFKNTLPNLDVLSLIHNNFISFNTSIDKEITFAYDTMLKNIEVNKNRRERFKKNIEEEYFLMQEKISKRKLNKVFIEIEGSPPCGFYYTEKNLPVFKDFKGKVFEEMYENWL